MAGGCFEANPVNDLWCDSYGRGSSCAVVTPPHTWRPTVSRWTPQLGCTRPKASDGHPDLSGQWTIIFSRHDLSRDLKPEEIQPWARALQKERAGTHQTALQTCLPIGPLNSLGTLDQEIKIVQTPNLIVILYGDLTYRQVFLDGRSLEKDPIPVGWAIRLGIGRARRWSSKAMAITTEPG